MSQHVITLRNVTSVKDIYDALR